MTPESVASWWIFHLAGPVDCLMGVDQQVHENLAQSCRITPDRRQIGLEVIPDLDLFIAGLMPHQFQHLLQDLIDVHVFHGAVRFPAEAQQAVDDPLAAVGFPDDHVQILGEYLEPRVFGSSGSSRKRRRSASA